MKKLFYFLTSEAWPCKLSIKKRLLVLIACICALTAYAETSYDFESAGIRYTVLSTTDLTAEVVGFAPDFTSDGIIDIPSQTEFRGRTLTVLGIAQNAFDDMAPETVSFNLGSLTYVRNQPDTKIYNVYSSNIERFTDGSCYPIATNCFKNYFVDGKPLEEINKVTSSNVDFCGVITLKQVNLLDNELKTMPSFRACPNLEHVSLPENAILPFAAFCRCVSLENVKVAGKGTYKADDSAFYGCTSLKRIDGWFDSYSLMRSTFNECPALESISLSKNVRLFICDRMSSNSYLYPFQGTPNIHEVNIQSLESWIDIDTRFYSNVEPYYPYYDISGHSTQGLEDFALILNGEPVEHLNIGENIKIIKANTFNGVNTLKSVVMGQNVTEIKNQAFYNCRNLTEVELNNSLQTIGEYAFAHSPIEHIDVPASVKYMNEGAFADVRSIDFFCNLKNQKYDCLGPNIEEIGFHSCDNSGRFESNSLRRVRIESLYEQSQVKIFYFNKNAFSNCPNLEELVIEKIETPYCFDENCFANTARKTLRLPSCPTICSGAFRDCSQLTNVEFVGSSSIMGHCDNEYTWNGQKFSGEAPFFNCSNLTSISFNANLNITHWYKYWGSSGGRSHYYMTKERLTPWYNCPVSEIIVNGSELDIDYHMNVEYPLKHLVLSDRTQWIHITGKNSSDEIAESGVRYQGYAFDYLIEPEILIESHNPTPPVIDGTLDTKIYLNATVRVPSQSLELYRESPSWKAFWNIEALTDGIESVDAGQQERRINIFNMQGICLKRNASQEDIDALAPGLYIIGNRKVLIK